MLHFAFSLTFYCVFSELHRFHVILRQKKSECLNVCGGGGQVGGAGIIKQYLDSLLWEFTPRELSPPPPDPSTHFCFS